MSTRLVYTTEEPRLPGYYWVRAPQLSERVAHFYHAHGQSVLSCDYVNLTFAYGRPVEYAGPVPTPLAATPTNER